MKRLARALCILALVSLVPVVAVESATAQTYPQVTSLSRHSAVYWGGDAVTVRGHNFVHVTKVMFGRHRAWNVRVVSSSTITLRDPDHGYGTVHVRVVTTAGWSARTSANTFTFVRPTMHSRIQGGLTGYQEQRASARARAAHRNAYVAPRSSRWTPAMGATAVARARSWMGVPYSWAGGNGRGPTRGVCAHNGGDLDCHIIGFDCSGLALYSWYPYRHLAHYAATQYWQAGRFHPAAGQLMPGDLVFFSGYIAGGIGHVAVYEGHGNVIEAEQSGTLVHRARLVDVIANSGRYRGATRPASSGRQGAVPVVTYSTPQVSTRGGYYVFHGRELGAATSVSVGTTRLYSFASRSSGRLLVKLPAHRSGRVTVTVSNAWGTVSRTLTYVGAPYVTTVTPNQATAGSTIVLTGRDVFAVTSATVDTTRIAVRHLGATKVLLTMPAHTPGWVSMTLASRFGTSNARSFHYLTPPAPKTSAPSASAASTPPASTASSSPSEPAPTSPTSETSSPSATEPSSTDPAPSQSSSDSSTTDTTPPTEPTEPTETAPTTEPSETAPTTEPSG